MPLSKKFPSKIAANGQVVVPKELRDGLGLKGGDIVVFSADEHAGIIRVTMSKPTISFSSRVGALKNLRGRDHGDVRP